MAHRATCVAFALLLTGCHLVPLQKQTRLSSLPPLPPITATAAKVSIQEKSQITYPTLSLLWDYTGSSASFNIYESTNLQSWTLITNVSNTIWQFQTQPGAHFFYVTATNELGESVPNQK